ncbi:MAG: cold shock domain-containing protein [Spirosoma sp.]|nr:cold shock domain-containing protein [Spirosoma sp.]
MQTGVVKFFNESKGYGFIVEDDTNRDIFVHVTGLNGLMLREKDRVQFEVVDGKKGLNAAKVTKLDSDY